MQRDQEGIRQVFEKSVNNLVAFRKIFLVNDDKEFDPAPFHYDWSNRLLLGTNHEAIEGFRESAKSQYVLRSFPQHALVFPDPLRDYIIFLKKNTQLARNKLREVEREYLSNPLCKANLVRILEQSAETFSVVVKSEGKEVEVRMEAYGKGASIRGISYMDRRPKIIIIDDPQDEVDCRENSLVSESDWTWFTSDVMFLGKYSRIFLIGNNLGERCIIERVFANKEQLGFNCSKVRQIREDGQPAWPARDTLEAIVKEKENYRRMGKLDVWLRNKMCEAVGDETRIFRRGDFRYFNPRLLDHLLKDANLFATIDPATSKNTSSCYRAMVINASHADGNWYIVDIPYGRWDSAEFIDILFEKVVQYSLRDVGIEKGQYKDVIEPFIYEEMRKRNIYFNIIPIEHAKVGSKLERIKMLQPRFKAHTILFPDYAPWVAELETELMGVTRDAIKSLQIDLVDALAMQEQIARKPYGKVQLANLPRTTEM